MNQPPRTSLFRLRRPPPGAAPDAFAPPVVLVEPRLRYTRLGPEVLEEGEVDVEAAAGLAPGDGSETLWIDVQGLGDGGVVRLLGEAFGIPGAAQADVVNFGQRPGYQLLPDAAGVLTVARRLLADDDGRVLFEQVSILRAPGLVLTFQGAATALFEPVRQRVRDRRPILMAGGADYLAVQLLDSVVEGYFPLLEQLAVHLEQLEDEILERPRPGQLERAHRMRRELLAFRRALWPLRDALNRAVRDEEFAGPGVESSLRDVTDLAHQAADLLETHREVAAGLVEVYLSMTGHRTNEVMRVLTVIATIFIPLTFLAGIYGMNFDPDVPGNLPELSWPYAYAVFWGVCILTGGGLLIVFRRLGWLGGDGP